MQEPTLGLQVLLIPFIFMNYLCLTFKNPATSHASLFLFFHCLLLKLRNTVLLFETPTKLESSPSLRSLIKVFHLVYVRQTYKYLDQEPAFSLNLNLALILRKLRGCSILRDFDIRTLVYGKQFKATLNWQNIFNKPLTLMAKRIAITDYL